MPCLGEFSCQKYGAMPLSAIDGPFWATRRGPVTPKAGHPARHAGRRTEFGARFKQQPG
jgi:hypothetical protein